MHSARRQIHRFHAADFRWFLLAWLCWGRILRRRKVSENKLYTWNFRPWISADFQIRGPDFQRNYRIQKLLLSAALGSSDSCGIPHRSEVKAVWAERDTRKGRCYLLSRIQCLRAAKAAVKAETSWIYWYSSSWKAAHNNTRSCSRRT